MAGESLKQFNKNYCYTTAGMPENNFNRNHEATCKPMDGWKGGIFSYANKDYGYYNMPTTTDSILAGIGNTSISGVDTATKINNAMMIGTGLMSLLTCGVQVANMFKSQKSNNTENSNESELSKLTREASKCKKKEREEISTKLGTEICSAKDKKSEALRNKNSNEVTLNNANKTITETTPLLDEAKANLEQFDNEKAEITHTITNMKSDLRNKEASLNSMTRTEENASEYDALKQEIEALKEQIKEQEELLETNYSDKDRKQITGLITTYETKIKNAESDIKIAEANIEKANSDIQIYTEEIQAAENAKRKLDTKINKD